MPPSSSPPCGYAPAEVPQFVTISVIGTGNVEGTEWLLELARLYGAKLTFFHMCLQAGGEGVLPLWKAAAADGHEVANATLDLVELGAGKSLNKGEWRTEIGDCTAILDSEGVAAASDVIGFQAPSLEYTDGSLLAVQDNAMRYDASIIEGYEPQQDGTNFYWPYTLDTLSPGHTAWQDEVDTPDIATYPGVWELGSYALIVPPELRPDMHARWSFFNVTTG